MPKTKKNVGFNPTQWNDSMKIQTLFKKIWPKILAVYPTVIWVNVVAIVCLGVGVGALSALHLNPTQLATFDSMFKTTLWIQGVLLGIHTWVVSCEDYPTTSDSSSLKSVTVACDPSHDDKKLMNLRRLKL